MPRAARRKSNSGIYHVVIRGIDKQIIFESHEDYEKFLFILGGYKIKCGYEIYAYCMLNNHIHLLIKEGNESISRSIQKIGTKFVYWYNSKYKRSGHLFQDRFKSKPVEDERYFLTVLRYIHQNPIRAGVENDLWEYPWSSFHEYSNKSILCNTSFVLDYFAKNDVDAFGAFNRFIHMDVKADCLDYCKKYNFSDSEAVLLIKSLAHVESTRHVSEFNIFKRNEILKTLKNQGLALRQIARLTGVSYGVVSKL